MFNCSKILQKIFKIVFFILILIYLLNLQTKKTLACLPHCPTDWGYDCSNDSGCPADHCHAPYVGTPACNLSPYCCMAPCNIGPDYYCREDHVQSNCSCKVTSCDEPGEPICDYSTCCSKRFCAYPPNGYLLGNCNGGICGGSCGGGPNPTDNPPPVVSCVASINPSQTALRVGGSVTLRVDVIADNTVSSVSYLVFDDISSIRINPNTDTSIPYQTIATSLSEGIAVVTAYVNMDPYNSVCQASSTITILPAGPWWQAKDANLTTSGSLASIIPSTAVNQNLILDGEGGFPGVALYNGVIDVGNGTISSKNWSVNSLFTSTKNYSYASISSQIPSDAVINPINGQSITQSDLMSASAEQYKGYYWFKYDGGDSGLDLSIDSDINLSTRKVILLVANADLYINGKINLTDGEGFFATIVGENQNGEKGNIFINPLVGGTVGSNPSLEGIYLADNQIKTGAGDTQLYVRGSLAALGGLIMERNLVNNALNPSEYFEFAPDQILLFPPQLNIRRYSWREIAP